MQGYVSHRNNLTMYSKNLQIEAKAVLLFHKNRAFNFVNGSPTADGSYSLFLLSVSVSVSISAAVVTSDAATDHLGWRLDIYFNYNDKLLNQYI